MPALNGEKRDKKEKKMGEKDAKSRAEKGEGAKAAAPSENAPSLPPRLPASVRSLGVAGGVLTFLFYAAAVTYFIVPAWETGIAVFFGGTLCGLVGLILTCLVFAAKRRIFSCGKYPLRAADVVFLTLTAAIGFGISVCSGVRIDELSFVGVFVIVPAFASAAAYAVQAFLTACLPQSGAHRAVGAAAFLLAFVLCIVCAFVPDTATAALSGAAVILQISALSLWQRALRAEKAVPSLKMRTVFALSAVVLLTVVQMFVLYTVTDRAQGDGGTALPVLLSMGVSVVVLFWCFFHIFSALHSKKE